MGRKVTMGPTAFGRARERALLHDTNKECNCIGEDSSLFENQLDIEQVFVRIPFSSPWKGAHFLTRPKPFDHFRIV